MKHRSLLAALIVALTLIAVLAASAAAGATQLDPGGGGTVGSPILPYQRWVDGSYAPTYPGRVQLILSPALLTCGNVTGAVGCTSWSQWPLPEVDVATAFGPYRTHQYLMHELGHVFDATEMRDPFRAEFMTIWGAPGGAGAWWSRFGSGYRSAGEWFAESYKLCALFGPQLPYQTWTADSRAYDFPGDRDWAKQDASCRLILNVGAAQGLPAPASPTVYAPRVLVRGRRKIAECRGTDLLLLGTQVGCERAGGGSASGPWQIVLQTRRMSKAELRRARLTVANGRPAFALVRH